MPEAHARAGKNTAERLNGAPRGRLNDLDQQIVAALQTNARATWRQIAAVIGSSESTVKRRAERLVQSGSIHVTILTEPVSPCFPVLVQCTCKLGKGLEVARRIADRDDARFVALITGPFDVVAELIVPSNRRLASIVLEELPKIPGITSTTTETVLRTFKTSYDWSHDVLGDRRAELEQPAAQPDDTVTPAIQDDISRHILAALRADGRCSIADLASQCHITESTARYRVDNLFTKMGIRPITLVDPGLLGYDAQLFIWLQVELAQLENVAAALASQREVRYIAATSGNSDLACEVFLPAKNDVYEFSTRVLGGLPGIQHVYRALELLTVKRAFLRVDHRPLPDGTQGGRVG
jgi:DNA-binding Lrp family transcriptional regulator